MLRFMLDTNIVIYIIKNRPPEARERFIQESARLCVSTVTVMELMFGVEASASPDKNRKNVEDFLARLEIVDYDAHAALHTGEIRAKLKALSTPIGPYDAMIAGHARTLGLAVVTNNVKEFERVGGLELENWINQ